MNIKSILPIFLSALFVACDAPPVAPTPPVTVAPVIATMPPTAFPPPPTATIAVTPTRSPVYLPSIHVAPTPNPQQVYHQSLMAWVRTMMQWADDLEATVASIAPTAPEWAPALTDLETRLLALERELQAMQPPNGYVNVHNMFLVSMDACTDAIAHYKDRKLGFGNLSFTVCAGGISMATSRLP